MEIFIFLKFCLNFYNAHKYSKIHTSNKLFPEITLIMCKN